MKFRDLTVLLLVLGSTSFAVAQDEPKPGKEKKNRAANFITDLEKKIETAEPTDEQKTKLKALSDEYTPKLAEVTNKFNEGMPEDVRKQLASARKELTASGTKGKELAAAMASKVTLTDEQKKLQEENNSAREKLQREIMAKVTEILTPEQIAKAGIKVPKARKGPKKAAA